MVLLVDVRLYNSSFTIFQIFQEGILFADKYICTIIGIKTNLLNIGFNDQTSSERITKSTKKCLKVRTSGLFLQPFVKACINSDVYRSNVFKYINRFNGNSNTQVFLKLILEPPDQEIIDYAWEMKLFALIWMKVEIDKAFSWLSTLGGAYSALGDYIADCAEQAGKISITQYKLSKLLGDESLAARSRLYTALAYAQKGNLKLSRHIVRNIAQFARNTKDVRLHRMCQGVWAKLKYLRQRRELKQLIDTLPKMWEGVNF